MADPRKQCKKLLKSFRKLRQRAEWKKYVLGGVFVLEVKHGKVGWHVHIHAIIQSKYWKWNRILSLWTKCSGGTACHIKQIPVNKAVGYITKYVSKASVEPELTASCSAVLKGCRLFNPFGTWYKLNKTYPKKTFVCPECGSSSWMFPSAVYQLMDYYPSQEEMIRMEEMQKGQM
jgi:hypothetical protein